MKVRFFIGPEMFGQARRELVQSGVFSAAAYRYESGVEAIELGNGHVLADVLPYQGQQIWRLFIDGENMTMKSMYQQPEATDNVFDFSYGAFLIHCGLTAMGNPSEEDPHPMHGELPHAKYQKVYLELGEDDKGKYIAIGGEYCYKLSIDTGYMFSPQLRLYEGERVLEMCCNIKNLRSTVLNYMYMAHINWLPVNGARLVYSAPKDGVEVFHGDFSSQLSQSEAERLEKYTSSLEKNPELADTLDFEKQCYYPELCCNLHYKPDSDGWAHSMQLRPDGTACYVGMETKVLENGLRWFCWTGDEMSCGFALPNTGNHKGRAYAIEHGLRKQLPPKGELVFRYRFGKLDSAAAKAMEMKIKNILS